MNYLKHVLLFLSLIVFSICTANAQPGLEKSLAESELEEQNLSGYHWKMKMMLPGEGVKAGLHKLPPTDLETNFWNSAKVPGDVYTDLWKVGAIDDPYFGRNSVRCQWVQQYEWWYAIQFNVTDDLADRIARLDFEGVDFACDVWLNGTFLGSHEGAFSPFTFDVNEALRIAKDRLGSSNLLMVRLAPPPAVNSLVAGRKTPWFGDYWRDLTPFGITGNVSLNYSKEARFKDVYLKPLVKSEKEAAVSLELEIEHIGKTAKSVFVNSQIEGQNFSSKAIKTSFEVVLKPGLNTIKKEIEIDNPQLWWTWDLGKPNLYVSKVSITDGDRTLDAKETTFGLRKVEMEWNPGFTRDEVSFPRTTVLNGKSMFIRSACWGGPPDIFVGRTTEDKYRKLIALAKDANMNNIRIFGWHPPEIPIFYQLCNEAGISVWQDIVPLGTGNFPQDDAFVDRIIDEAVGVVKERRNNPSLIMMEGGEEMFLRATDPVFTRRMLEKLGGKLQENIDLPFVPDSPMTDEPSQEAGFKPKEAVHALAYFYGMGRWLMEDWIKGMNYPIVPELAVTSVPNVESLKKFIPENEIWPPGLSWGHHWADLDHLRMQNFDTFGNTRTASLQEFVDATQDSQGTVFQLTIEHFRRNKPKTSGIAICHLMTYWPDMKWGIIDNYQTPKRSFDFVKRAYQPLLVNLNFTKRRWMNEESFKGEVWIVNDLYQDYQNLTATYEILDQDKNVLVSKSKTKIQVKENSSKQFFTIDESILDKVKSSFTVNLTLKDSNGEVVSSNTYQFLIGNQELADAEMKKMGEERNLNNQKYTYGNYFMFYPKYNGEGKQVEGKTDEVKAAGFGN
ncbi:beta-mannosidase [Arcticibacterium luteifluviistationis]|uniref:Beta-mannosidase B n=1 Tax=Arcticibacterium luteifluviistationis TaxID=1784714 RepID=A0A2Z4G6M2_9BACT|nr:sugar-binding domain-containing protein [Arcticibacterium luteifluviistationis]AWV96760.1 beta-galactosidase [Arcticibacterium luteifluviistationis]